MLLCSDRNLCWWVFIILCISCVAFDASTMMRFNIFFSYPCLKIYVEFWKSDSSILTILVYPTLHIACWLNHPIVFLKVLISRHELTADTLTGTSQRCFQNSSADESWNRRLTVMKVARLYHKNWIIPTVFQASVCLSTILESSSRTVMEALWWDTFFSLEI